MSRRYFRPFDDRYGSNPKILEHDPEKWIPVFGKRSCSKKKLERDDDSKKSHHALACKNATRRANFVARVDTVTAGFSNRCVQVCRSVERSKGNPVRRPCMHGGNAGAAPATVGGEPFLQLPLGLPSRPGKAEEGDDPRASRPAWTRHPSGVRGARAGRLLPLW